MSWRLLVGGFVFLLVVTFAKNAVPLVMRVGIFGYGGRYPSLSPYGSSVNHARMNKKAEFQKRYPFRVHLKGSLCSSIIISQAGSLCKTENNVIALSISPIHTPLFFLNSLLVSPSIFNIFLWSSS